MPSRYMKREEALNQTIAPFQEMHQVGYYLHGFYFLFCKSNGFQGWGV